MKIIILIIMSFAYTFASDAQECNEIISRVDQDSVVISNQEKMKLKSCLLNFLMGELGSELNYENGFDYEPGADSNESDIDSSQFID